MKNIVLTRIDDRLLHGQVIVSWIPFLKIDEIVIVDDEYSKDEFMADLIKEAAPESISVHVLSPEKSAEYILSEDKGKRVLLLSRDIESIRQLIGLKVPISLVNIGGMGYRDGREKYVNAIHMSQAELNMLKEISSDGIKVEIQMLPNDKAMAVV